MRRIPGLLALAPIAGFGVDALAKAARPSTTCPQIGAPGNT